MIYNFEQPSLLFAYCGEELSGIFVLQEKDKIDRSELFGIFQDFVDVIMTVPIKQGEVPIIDFEEDDELTFEEIMMELRDQNDKVAAVIQRAELCILGDDECQYQISRVLH